MENGIVDRDDTQSGDYLGLYETWFDASQSANREAAQESNRARDYVDGRQLTSEEVAALQKRGQPDIVINRVRRKVEFLKGLEIRTRTDPKAYPRTPEHAQGAEAASDAIRFVCDNNNWDEKRTAVYDNMLTEGYGGAEVIHKQMQNGQVEVVINHYPWDMLFYDPHSRRPDFSDARYKGVAIWMDLDELPDEAADAVGAMQQEYSKYAQHEDKPNIQEWFDGGRKRVRIVLMWAKHKGVWHWCYFVKGHKLAEGESLYVDEDGESECPLEMQSGYVGRQNDRYGVVRDMFGPQDEVNKRRSKALHDVSTRQVIMTRGAADPATIRREVAKPDGIIEINGGADDRFDINANADLSAGQFALLQEAKQEMDLLGANAALAGETGESASGRAVLARQQGGMTEIAAFQDGLHQFTRRVFRQIWNRIRQFWTEERWIRVTDDDRNVKFVGLNQPIRLMDQLSQLPEEQMIQAVRELGLGPNDPRLTEVVDIQNPVEQLDVDILIEEVPDRITLQGETFEALLRYAQAGAIPPQVLIEADPSLPTKKKEQLLEQMTQPQQPTPEQDLEAAEKMADIEKTRAEAGKAQADMVKTRTETVQAVAG